MIKKVLIRIMFILVLITGVNYIYIYTFYPMNLRDLCEHVLIMKQKSDSTDVLYFSESSNFNAREDDSTYLSISELSNLFYPSIKIHAVNQPASHAGIYRYWLNQIDLKNNKPKAIVVALNMRSFDAAWIYSPAESSLQESIALLQPYPPIINRFLLSLQAFNDITETEREFKMKGLWKKEKLTLKNGDLKYKNTWDWDKAMGEGSYLKEDGSWDFDKIRLACHYVKAYAFNIKETNPRIKDFDFIVKWSEKNGIPLYFNLLAENIEYADSLVGKDLVFLMKENRDFLMNRYNTGNCKVIDNLEKINGLEFSDQTWTTEHYGYKGRMIIARNLAETLRNQFKNEYIKAY
ncbi:MAG: hypothetical protein IPM51_08215 [Sphingobacteriaceae bacterium]|nr:hypothetical protein [Sphingobacteriaceae bacterium]